MIDVIVVIIIMVILASLILPGMLNVRRPSGRASCMNSLKNLGISMHQFLAVHQEFPAAGRWDVPDVSGADGKPDAVLTAMQFRFHDPSAVVGGFACPVVKDDYRLRAGTNGNNAGVLAPYGMKYSWVYDLLPYLERDDLWLAWDIADEGAGGCYLDSGVSLPSKKPSATKDRKGICDVELGILRCTWDTTATDGVGNSSYVVNGGFTPHWALRGFGHEGVPIPTSSKAEQDDLFRMGLMFTESAVADGVSKSARVSVLRRRHRVDTVRDGTATTVVMAENINAGFDRQVRYGKSAAVEEINWACPHPWNTSFFVRADTPGISQPICLDRDAGPYRFNLSNERSGSGGGINGDLSGLAESKFPYPNSLHSGGVNVLMVDGSTRFIADSIDGDIWARLVTPDGANLSRLEDRQQALSESDLP